MKTYIALDVGGTQIKAGVVTESGRIISPKITHYDANATASQEIILSHLYQVITDQLIYLPEDATLGGVGIAFPGPFDYENGICLIQGINKYDTIYGVNLKTYLIDQLSHNNDFMKRCEPAFDVKFQNDASLYALGETVLNNAPTQGKCLCLCIGTGLGSAFLEDGKLITSGTGVPAHGWVYHVPFKESIIDDYISARGILKLYNEISGETFTTVKPIADLAYAHDASALLTFYVFGKRFANAIEGFLSGFEPTTLVIGGQISKSYPLFSSGFLEHIKKQHPSLDIRLSADTSLSTLLGVIPLFF